MEYRVEDKYFVTDADLILIENRIKTIMGKDEHQKGDCYEIRSLYFDNEWNQCMDENEAGVDERKKYRIRIYEPDAKLIRLEIKEKLNGLTKKESCILSKDESLKIMNNSLPLILDKRKPLNLLQIQMRCSNMKPKVIISYERTAYVYQTGNVRVTFDCNIAASECCNSFFNNRVDNNVPVLPKGIHILEVKYDELLPDFIASQLEIGTLRKTAFSKYYLGREATEGDFISF